MPLGQWLYYGSNDIVDNNPNNFYAQIVQFYRWFILMVYEFQKKAERVFFNGNLIKNERKQIERSFLVEVWSKTVKSTKYVINKNSNNNNNNQHKKRQISNFVLWNFTVGYIIQWSKIISKEEGEFNLFEKELIEHRNKLIFFKFLVFSTVFVLGVCFFLLM